MVTPKPTHSAASRIKHRPGERIAKGPGSMAYYERRTLFQVSQILGVTKERVRQIERMALWKIRKALKSEWDDISGRSP